MRYLKQVLAKIQYTLCICLEKLGEQNSHTQNAKKWLDNLPDGV